jgi:hypothetical protein
MQTVAGPAWLRGLKMGRVAPGVTGNRGSANSKLEPLIRAEYRIKLGKV